MDKFPKTQVWAKLTQEEIENQNSPIISKEAECLKNLIPYHYISFFIKPDFYTWNNNNRKFGNPVSYSEKK